MATKTDKKKITRKKATARKTAAAGKKVTARKTAAAGKKTSARKTTTKKRARKSPPRIVLHSESGIRDVAKLYAELGKIVGRPEAIVIDASDVDRIDTSMLQVLAAFVRDRHAGGLTVTWSDTPSEAFLRAGRLLDLEAHLFLGNNEGAR
jgi:ABC-type transporter Mla MlaB component